MNTPSLDLYLEYKARKATQIFIFLLDREALWLDEDTCWVHHLRSPCHLLRMTPEEFKMLDIGVHPKTVVTKASQEMRTFNGVPTIQQLRKTLTELI